MNSTGGSLPPGHSLTGRLTSIFGWVIAMALAASAVSLGVLLLVLLYFEPRTAHIRNARRSVLAGHQAMLDEETALRGFLLTRDAAFLEPLRAARPALEAANDALVAAIGTEGELAPLLLEKRLAEQRWIDGWARPIERDVGQASHPGVTSADGKALFDVYRVRQGALLEALDRRILEVDAERRLTLEIGVGLKLTIFVVILGFTARQRRVLRNAVTEPLARLLESIRRVRDGDRDVQVPGDGPAELGQIALALNEMTHALAEERAQREAQDAELTAQAQRLRTLLDSAREFSESLNLSYVLQSIGRAAAGVTVGAEVTIWLVDDTSAKLVTVYDSAWPKEAPPGVEPIAIGEGVEGRAAKYGRTMIEPPSDSAPDLVASSGFPMVVGARVIGVIAVRPTPAPRKRDPAILEILEMLAMHAGAAIESARLHEQTEERSKRDALTTLYNRRRLDEDLLEEIRRCARYERPLSFLMIDVDHFKDYNDTHGHAAGDAALQRVAEVLRAAVRNTDSVYRYGGEEFSVLLRETSVEGARELAERLCRQIAARFADEPHARRLTASIGVAPFDRARPSPGALVEAADGALYEAKRAGRNQVAVAGSALAPVSQLVPSEGRLRSAKRPL